MRPVWCGSPTSCAGSRTLKKNSSRRSVDRGSRCLIRISSACRGSRCSRNFARPRAPVRLSGWGSARRSKTRGGSIMPSRFATMNRTAARRRVRPRRVRRLRHVVASRSSGGRAEAGLRPAGSRRPSVARRRRVAMDVTKPAPPRPSGRHSLRSHRARHRSEDSLSQQALLPVQSLADLDLRLLHRARSAHV